MFSKKSLLAPAVLIFICFLGVSAISAQAPKCQFSLESLQGNYAVVLTYGANVALGLQTEYLDGKGNLARTGVINQPTPGSTTGARTLVTVSSKGTYTVNCDGTGTFTRIVTRQDGSTAPAEDDFIITKSEFLHGWPWTAITISDAQRNPSVILPGGVFVTRVHTRLSD